MPPPSRPDDDLDPAPGEPVDDARLLRAAGAGDDAAFATLLERHDRLLHQFAHHLLDGVGTEAVLEEAYVKAYRAVSRQRGPARPWLLRTVYLAGLDEVRRRERRRQGGPGRKPDRESRPDTGQPLAHLRPDQRAVLVLVEGAGLGEAEVAAVLGSPEPTVRGLLARARLAGEDPGPALDLEDVPPHDQGFWSRLGGRLLAERDAPAAPVPRMPDPDEPTSAIRTPRPPPVAMQKRAPRRARFRRSDVPPDTVEELATDARRRRTPVRLPALALRVLTVLVVLAVLAGVLVAVVTMAARARSPVREDSVADISGRTVAALADARSFSAVVDEEVVGADGRRTTSRYQLARHRNGSYLMIAADLRHMVAYDTPTNTLRSRRLVPRPDGSTAVLATQETGLAAGPPDPSGLDPTLPDAELSLALRSLADVDEEAAGKARVGGRAVWVLGGPLPDPGRGPDRVVLVVDRARLAPVRITLLRRGRSVRTVRFSEVALDAPVGPFTIDLSADGVRPVDRGFRPVGLDDVVSAVGYAPLRPAYLPPGFELAASTVRRQGRVVSVAYQRGNESVVVTTRSSPVQRGDLWADPFDRGGHRPRVERVQVTSGPFRLTTAQRVAEVGALPSVWGSNDTLAFTVAGDLTAEQLIRVVASLR